MKDIDDEFLQFLLNQMHKAYSDYKRENPQFAKVVEEDLEGKTDAEFEAQFKEEVKIKTHCESCGEWLGGFDQCDQCGRINK